jgi:hypothetical protein
MNPSRAMLLIPFALCAAVSLPAQGTSLPRDDGVGIAAGYSWASTQRWGLIRNRHVSRVDVHLETQLVRSGAISLVHTFAVPLTVVARKSNQVTIICWPRDPSVCMPDTSSAAEVGIGVVPIGLKAYLGDASRVRMYMNLGGGIVGFSGNMPTIRARRLNFLAEAGIGVELGSRGPRRFVLGYRYVHMSNGDTAPSNPGIDANLLYMGLIQRSAR